jgi:hypothetical protein
LALGRRKPDEQSTLLEPARQRKAVPEPGQPTPDPAARATSVPKTDPLIRPTASLLETATNAKPQTSNRFAVNSIPFLSPCRKRTRW